MSGYLRSKVFETNFDGDRVKARLKPIKWVDVQRLGAAKDESEGISILQDLLPSYVEELTGLNDAAGSPIGIGELCRDAYFVRLVAALGENLLESAKLENPQKPAEPSAS